MKAPNLKNGDLKTDLEKIKRYDTPLTFRKDSFKTDQESERTFTIEVCEDSSYLYVNEDERNIDYELLKIYFANGKSK